MMLNIKDWRQIFLDDGIAKSDFDKNPTYGDYEYEDGTMRKNTMEMIDQNQDYYEQTMVRKKNICIYDFASPGD